MRSLFKMSIATDAIDQIILKVAEVARQAGISGAYIAGGWVRDKILGKNSKDVDITVENGKGIELAEAVANSVGYKLNPNKDIYKAKGTAKVSVPTSEGNLLVEFVSARKESYAPEGHKPTEVQVGTIEDDVLRRDFTLNSLIINIQDYRPGMVKDEFKKIVKDLTGKGLSDLENGILRTPLNPIQTFEDDPTRIARAIRFCAQKGFQLSPEVEEAIKNGQSSMGESLKEMLITGRKAPKGTQIGDELRKAFLSNPTKTVQLLKDTGLGDSLGMNLNLLDVEQTDYRGLHNKDVYQHSLSALNNITNQIQQAKVNGEIFDEDRELALVLSAIYHDIGKKQTRQIVCGGKIDEEGKLTRCDYVYKPDENISTCPKCGAINRAKIQFIGHEQVSGELIDPSLEKFFGKKVREKIKGLVMNHMAHHNYSRDRELEIEKLNKIKQKTTNPIKLDQLEKEIKRKEALVDIPSSRKELAKLVEMYSKDSDIRYLWQADLTTEDREHKTQRGQNIDKLIQTFEEFGPVESALNGKEIMEIFNIPPGPTVKKILEQLKQLKVKNSKYGDPEQVREYLKDKQLNPQGVIILKQPILDGNDLMKLYDRSPGSWLQPMLQKIREETLKGTFKTKEEAIKWLEDQKDEFGQIKESMDIKSLCQMDTTKTNEVIFDFRNLSVESDFDFKGLSAEAAYWSPLEIDTLKSYYLQERGKGRKDDNNIYTELADKLSRTPRAIKQKVEQLKNTDDEFTKYKFKHWTRATVIENLERIYESNKENFHRTGLPEDLRSQIKLHSGDWFSSFDDAMAEAIYNVEKRNGKSLTMNDARKDYLHQHKLAHRWNKDEIISLFKAAHDAGLPVTRNFFAKQPEVYKPILGVNRSLEGLKDSVKRYFDNWGSAIIQAGLVDDKYYTDEGKPLGSTEEVRIARFFDLNNIKYRRCIIATDKIAVTDPEVLELGYKNFVGDFYLLDDSNKEVALVEVFGSIINSGKMNHIKNKTVGELYQEKREAKINYYSKALQMPFIFIDNDEEKGLSDETLKEKFSSFFKKEVIGTLRALSKVSDGYGQNGFKNLAK